MVQYLVIVAVRVYRKNHAIAVVIAILAAIIGHAVKGRAHQDKGAIRAGPVLGLPAKSCNTR